MRSPTMLKYACRARSEVGRTSRGGTPRRRPRREPAVMRTLLVVRHRLADEVVRQILLVDVDDHRLPDAVKLDDAVHDALHAPRFAIVAHELVPDLRLIVGNAVRHRAIERDGADEIFDRMDLVAELLRTHADGIEREHV